jgi:hypothetical protein
VSDHDKRLRAELAAELGYIPASSAPEDIDGHRRLNTALDIAPTMDQISRKYAHFREEKRRADVEAQGRADVDDLYEDL